MAITKTELENKFPRALLERIPDLKQEISFVGSILKSNENRLQAILAYCLDPNQGHSINHVFFEALTDCIGQHELTFTIQDHHEDYEVITEFETDKKGRIDVLIKTIEPWDVTRKAIIIELKIDSDLHNDLEDYYDSINDCRDEHKIGIVLAVNKIPLHLIHKEFHFISLYDYFDAIRTKYDPNDVSPQEKQFFQDFFNFSDLFKNNFYDKNCDSQLSFLLNNGDSLNELNHLLKTEERNKGLNMWYISNKDALSKITRSISFVRTNISSFLKDWRKVSGRKGEVHKIGKLFFRSKNSVFSGFYRITLDYTEVFKLNAKVTLKIELAKSFEVHPTFDMDFQTAINQFQSANFTFANVTAYNQTTDYAEVVYVEFTNGNEISKFYDFLFGSVMKIVDEVEGFINEKFESKFTNKIVNNLCYYGSELTTTDDTVLIDTIPVDIIIREPDDYLFISLKWLDSNVFYLSIWSIVRTEKWLENNEIDRETAELINHLFDEKGCFYNADINTSGEMDEIHRNFSRLVVIDNIQETEKICKEISKSTFEIIKRMRRIIESEDF